MVRLVIENLIPNYIYPSVHSSSVPIEGATSIEWYSNSKRIGGLC